MTTLKTAAKETIHLRAVEEKHTKPVSLWVPKVMFWSTIYSASVVYTKPIITSVSVKVVEIYLAASQLRKYNPSNIFRARDWSKHVT